MTVAEYFMKVFSDSDYIYSVISYIYGYIASGIDVYLPSSNQLQLIVITGYMITLTLVYVKQNGIIHQ